MLNDIFRRKTVAQEWQQERTAEPLPHEGGSPGQDGWVEPVGNRLVVHDPSDDGRYPSIAPAGGVRLWAGHAEVTGPTVVASTDELRWEISGDPEAFAVFEVSPDQMQVTMQLIADPVRIPDTVVLTGVHPTVVHPGFSPRARERVVPPRDWIGAQLALLGVTSGIDESAIEAELRTQTGKPVVIAHGQAALAYHPGTWHWRLAGDEPVAMGQVIAVCEGAQEARPRITVTAAVSAVDPVEPEPQAYIAGQGTRLVRGRHLVATADGRPHRRPDGSGCRVDILPQRVLEGPLTGELVLTDTDLLIRGEVQDAQVRVTGRIQVEGSVRDSELIAEAITVTGEVRQSRLMTLPHGHYRPLTAELAHLYSRILGLGRLLETERSLPESRLCELGVTARALERRAAELGIEHPQFAWLMSELLRTFSPLAGGSEFGRSAAERLLPLLDQMQKTPAPLCGTGDVAVGFLADAAIWAERHVSLAGGASGAAIYAGGSISAAPESLVAGCRIAAGQEVRLGNLAAASGQEQVTVHSRRLTAGWIGAAVRFEFGAGHHTFAAACGPTLALADAAGRIHVRDLPPSGI